MKRSDAICLVTKADDIGSNDSANRAFVEGYEKGMLRNGVIMMTCGKAEEAARRFRGETGFCMGLHLTMNAEWDRVKWGPVAPRERVPTIVDENGWLYQTTQALHDAHPSIDEILLEMDAQLDLARSYGLDIYFADAHMLFTWAVEGLENAVREWCAQRGLIFGMGDVPSLPWQAPGATASERLIAKLEGLQPGVYAVHLGHPAFDSTEMRALGHPGYDGDTVAQEREEDRRALSDPMVLRYFEQHNIVPVTLRQAIDLLHG